MLWHIMIIGRGRRSWEGKEEEGRREGRVGRNWKERLGLWKECRSC